MLDTDVGQKPETIRYDQADNAYHALIDEIGELSEAEITEQNAPFIAGLVIARSIELHFLDTHHARIGVDNPAHPHWRKMDIEDKRTTARDHRILSEARKGYFSKLKSFVKDKVDAYKDLSADYIDGDPENQQYLRIGRNLQLIAERTPLIGDGSSIKVPNPAHIEEPVPLGVQLGRFAAGGEIR